MRRSAAANSSTARSAESATGVYKALREVADFEVAPHTGKPQPAAPAVPEVLWTEQDLADLAKIANASTLAIMDLCSLSSGTWIAAGNAYQRAGVTTASGAGQLGGFGLTMRAKFKRSNPPYERQWAAGGTNQAYYRIGPELGSVWREIRGESLPMSEPQAGAQVPMDGRGRASTLTRSRNSPTLIVRSPA